LTRQRKDALSVGPRALAAKPPQKIYPADSNAKVADSTTPPAMDSDISASESPTKPAAPGPNLIAYDNSKATHDFLASFISKAIENMPPPRQIKLTPEEEERSLRRALLPYKVDRQARELEQKNKEIKQLNQAFEQQRQAIKKLQEADLRKSSVLSILIHAVKANRTKNGLSLSAQNVAAQVDEKLREHDLQLRQVCPKNWRKRLDLPHTLSGCLTHNDRKLRQATKTLISRA
jgi:hypothetical protein